MLDNQDIPKGMTISDFEEAWKKDDDAGGDNAEDADSDGEANDNQDQQRLPRVETVLSDDDGDGGDQNLRNRQPKRRKKRRPQKTRKQLQSAISYWTENVRGTDQYWNAERRRFIATVFYHNYMKGKEMRHYLTGSQAEFHDPFLRWLLAKYAQKVTGDEDIYDAILTSNEAFHNAVAKYKNVVTHFFAFKNEMWICTILKNAYGVHDVFGVYEFAKGRGAIHTHFAAFSSLLSDEEIDAILLALACEIYDAFNDLIDFSGVELCTLNGTPKEMMVAFREIIQGIDGGNKRLHDFDEAIKEHEAKAAYELGRLQAKHYGLSAYHIGVTQRTC